jgi:nucleoside-diphosphate-sugar epimerase
LVTGAAGFAGSHIVRALLERGDRVVALDLAPQLPAFVTNGLGDVSPTYLVGDVTDSHQIAGAVLDAKVEDIVHTAAAMGDADSVARPRHFLRVNAEAVWGLCDLARRLPMRRLVCMSTRSIYGAYTPEEGPVGEDAAPRPIGFYGASKAAADVVAIQYRQQYGLDVVLPRVTGLYGPNQQQGQNVLAQMVAAAVAGEPFTCPMGPDYRYEVIYVKDVARGVLAILDAPRLAHPVYNVGSGEQPAVAELAAIVRTILPEADITFDEAAGAAVPPRAQMAVDRFAGETGFRTAWTIQQGVRELVTWHRTGAYGRPAESPPDSIGDH